MSHKFTELMLCNGAEDVSVWSGKGAEMADGWQLFFKMAGFELY